MAPETSPFNERLMTEGMFIPGPERRLALRETVGCFGIGVNIVSTITDNGLTAITVNSFASVSSDRVGV